LPSSRYFTIHSTDIAALIDPFKHNLVQEGSAKYWARNSEMRGLVLLKMGLARRKYRCVLTASDGRQEKEGRCKAEGGGWKDQKLQSVKQ